ncbi:hypothetical protein KCU61_g3516, partial [Aureobasidium melanogenum]
MQRIIQELGSLQLSEASKGYFLELLKHMDNRDKEWSKVVKMWETYESSSSSPDKAVVEIMRNVQDIFVKDDDFLKHLYKGPKTEGLIIQPNEQCVLESASVSPFGSQSVGLSACLMNNVNTTASKNMTDNDKAAKDSAAVFTKGTAKGSILATLAAVGMAAAHITAIDDHMRSRNEECAKVHNVCQDYMLHSSNLDGSVLEILQEVQKILDKDSHFLSDEHKRHVEDIKTLSANLEDTKKQLEQQISEGH